MKQEKDQVIRRARRKIEELTADLAARDATIAMTVKRLGGMVEGRPTERVNFLQRIDELRLIEIRAATVTECSGFKAVFIDRREVPEYESTSALDGQIQDWQRNGGTWEVLAMASLIGDLIAARDEPALCDACGKELQDDVNVEQSLEGLKTAKYLYHKCAAEGCQWLAVKNERAPWYPCTCGGEHNTPDCPFGYPLKP